MKNAPRFEAVEYLEGEGQIAIFDGSNLTKSRREHIMNVVKEHVFTESFDNG